MAEITPFEFLRLALDPVRLAILGQAACGEIDPAELASKLGLPKRRVLQAVGKLREAGLLDKALRLDAATVRALAEAVSELEAPPPTPQKGEWSPDELEVLGRFFRGGRLTQIPAQRSKRLVVLERLALEFEPGLRYEEWRVDLVLKAFHADYVSLRRYLVDETMLSREAGVYWRSGGRVQS